MTTLDLSNALGGSGSKDSPDLNVLSVFTMVVVVVGLTVLFAIGVSNWRASIARKAARRRWANARTGPYQLSEREAKPNPLRKAN